MKWAAALVLVLIVGLLSRLNLRLYAMYVLAGVLLLNRYFTRSWIEGLTAAREGGGKTLEQGQSLEFMVTVRHASRLTIPWLLMEDSLPRPAPAQVPPRIRAEGPRVKLTRLGPGGIESLTYRVSFLMRGYYQIGPVWLETGDVFGLHRRYRVTAEPQFVQVLPKVLALQGYNLA